MKSAAPGRRTSDAEVTNVSPHGFWILLDGREVFAPFREFPWFAQATIQEIVRIERPSPHHLYWPALDVDLAVESLDHPDRYPLLSRIVPRESRQGAAGPRRTSRAKASRGGTRRA